MVTLACKINSFSKAALFLTGLTVVLTGCFEAKIKSGRPAIVQGAASIETLSISRTSLAVSVKESVVLSGTCLTSMALKVQSPEAATQLLQCVSGKFQITVLLSGTDGAKVIVISQTDAAGRLLQDSVTINKDTVAPLLSFLSVVKANNTLIISGTCEEAGTIFLSGNISAAAGVTCKNNSFQIVGTPSLGDGSKNIEISQTDTAGNKGIASRLFVLDSTAPVVTITSPGTGAQFENSFQLKGSCESALDVSASGTGVSETVSVPCTNGIYALNVNLSANLGTKEVVVSQIDTSGNRFQAVIVIQRIIAAPDTPVVTILQPAVGLVTKSGITLSGTCTAGLMVNISGAVNANSSTTCTTGSFSAAIVFAATDGNKTITATQVNSRNVSGASSRNFVRDTTAPVVTIARPLANALYGPPEVVVSGVCETGIMVSLYGAGTVATTSATCANGVYSGAVNLTGGDGNKEIRAGQTDGAQNFGIATVTVRRDTVAPLVSISDPAAGTVATNGLNLRGNCEIGLPVLISGSGVASPVQGTCANSNFAIEIIFSAVDGTKEVAVSQTDEAGNKGMETRSYKKAALPALDGAKLYAVNCATCHSALPESTKHDRSASQIKSAILNVASMSSNIGLSTLTTAQIEAIATALKVIPADAQANPFLCESGALPAAHRLQRLAKSEYVNTIRDLFAGVVTIAELSAEMAFFPEELNSDNPFDRGADSLNLGLVVAHNKISSKIANLVTLSTTKTNQIFIEACFANYPATDACLGSFLDRFGAKVYRRPVKAAERTPLINAYRIGNTKAESSAYVLRALLMSPHFLYHLEYDGTPLDTSISALKLSAFEFASRLSYLIVNSAPDIELTAAAANGSILNDATLDIQLKRMLALPAARTSFRRFFSSWFDLNRMREASYSSAFKNGIDTADINAVAVEESLLFTDHVLFEGKKLSSLLTDNTAFIKSQALAQIYGIAMPTTPDGKVLLPATQRAGLLTRAARTMSGANSTSPIIRGVAIKRSMLCDSLSAPDANSLPAGSLTPPIDDPTLSTRRRYEIKTSGAACISCHSQINPFGFALERYDALGRHRTVERLLASTGAVIAEHPIDANVTINLSAPPDPMVDGGIELSSTIANSQKFPMCFAKRWFQFSIRRSSNSRDNCALATTYDALKNPNATLLDTIKITIANPEFKMRRIK